MKKMSKINAFTLIELVIVIAIVGLIAAIPIIAFSQATQKARDTRRKQDIDKVNGALTQYRTENGHYPIRASYSLLATDLMPTFLSQLPTDPRNVSPYVYSYSSTDGEYYTLGAVLEKMNGANNERYFGTTGGGMTITGTPVPPTAVPTGINPLSITPTPTPDPTPSFTPTPTP